jgi:hypothetical protein
MTRQSGLLRLDPIPTESGRAIQQLATSSVMKFYQAPQEDTSV